MRTALHGLALAVCGCALYANTLDGPFLFDDHAAIVDNPSVRAPRSLGEAFRAPDESTLAGRPLVTASFALNHALGGLAPRGYHAVNVAIHVLCAIALYGVVRRTVRADGPAFSAALIWLVHPLCTEAVNYVVQRTETMMALFFLLTLYAAIRAADSRRTHVWRAVAIVSCAAGMACKESMVVAPLLVVLWDRAYLPGPLRRTVRERWPLYLGLAATWIVLAALVARGPRDETVGFALGTMWWNYALNQFDVVAGYLAHAFWPHPLVFDYGYPKPLSLAQVVPQAAIVLALAAAAAVLAWRRPRAGYPAAAFVLLLAPASSVVPIVTEVGAERRMYLPLAALVALLIVPLPAAVSRVLRGPSLAARWASVGLVAVLAAALATTTRARNREYADEETIWRSAIGARPANERAHNGLGHTLYRAGRLDEAETSYRRALALEPDYYQAQYNLGLLLADRGRTAEALERLARAAKLQPARAEPHYRIAAVHAALGERELSITALRRALHLDPELAEAHNDLGNALVAVGRTDDGLGHLRRALELRPDFALGHYNLALALGELGDLPSAERHARAAIALAPRFAAAHNNLGTVLQRQGRLGEALAAYRAALDANPGSVDVRNNLGLALAALGQPAEAAEVFREALALDPQFELARRNLAEVERALGSAAQ